MKVVVIGAGYAGVLAANRVARKVRSAEVTVINPRPDFVERVRLHQQIAGTGAAATPLTSMLRAGITTRTGTAVKIGNGAVALEDGTHVPFDYSFLAVGSAAMPMPGTIPVGTWEGAEQARAAFAELPAGGTVTVVGGGSTGIETAAEVACARPDVRVRLAGSSVAGTFSHGARRRVRAGLERLKVDLVDDKVTEVSAGTGRFGGIVRLRSGTAFASDLTLWAVMGGVPDLAAHSGLDVDTDGRAIVDEFLRSVNDERIFVVGDCAAVPRARMACQTAQPQAAYAAGALARLIGGRTPEPYSMGYLAQTVSLGRQDAVSQFTHLDDTLRRAYVAGRAGVAVKEATCRTAKYVARTGFGVSIPGPK
ncbi:NAD(P)/FAD-dependent oxidoreductase [Nonomuraea candida]|uniref:NAD(P)/FAD-dependent oxidoreductase n=1 Tax=Nonomuraea candida TaxID=359159 RepID=UPI0005BE76A2|nr:FAD-dependent oxidoreductase [Nonomuraea candida]